MSDCDRCGAPVKGRGTLPTNEETYRFCPRCWNELHEWVEEGPG